MNKKIKKTEPEDNYSLAIVWVKNRWQEIRQSRGRQPVSSRMGSYKWGMRGRSK